MKCPSCGNELEGKNICSRCGKKVDIPEQEWEIEYKEFKISELLEIRKKQKKSHANEAGETDLDENKKQKKFSETISARHKLNKKPKILKQEARRVTHDKRKNFIITAIVILLIIAFIAETYYFLRLLFQQ
jgi:Flp pilus assembly protein TadB